MIRAGFANDAVQRRLAEFSLNALLKQRFVILVLLSRDGRTANVLSLDRMKYQLKRWRMRRKLQAVRNDDRDFQKRQRNDRTFH